jgi:hypothetical protein
MAAGHALFGFKLQMHFRGKFCTLTKNLTFSYLVSERPVMSRIASDVCRLLHDSLRGD